MSKVTDNLKRRKRTRLGVAMCATFLVFIAAGLGLAYRAAKPEMSVGETKRDVSASLPVGSSIQEINAFLDRQGFRHSEPLPAREFNLPLDLMRAAVRPEQLLIKAYTDSTAWRWINDPSELEIWFVLDDDLELQMVSFRELS